MKFPAIRLTRLLLLAAWTCAPLISTAQETTPEPDGYAINALHFSGEPVGDESALSYDLDADARLLLKREPALAAATTLDDTAATLERGDRIRAFAEALAVEESTDPDLRARSHVRRAWILGEIGAVNYGAGHANEGTIVGAVPGELYLARAWLRWRAGDFEGADREAAFAAKAKPAAPTWALAAWEKHRAAHTAADLAFGKLSEPDDSTSPEFIAYANAARAAGAFNVADEAYFSALNLLHQQRSAEPTTPPDGLFRASIARRDFLLGLLGAPSPATVGPRLWSTAVFAARSAATLTPDRAAWEKYFSLLYVAQTAVPGFDFTDFDLPGDLTLAEQAVKLAPVWRQRLAPLLARPDLRYASRELQALAKFEAHPAFEYQAKPLNATLDAQEIEHLDAFIRLMSAENQALAELRADLPANTPPPTRELMFRRLFATQSFRLAVARERFDVAHEHVEALRKLRTADGEPVVEAEQYAAALPELERKSFYTFVAELAATPPDLFDPFDLEDLAASVDEFVGWFVTEVGPDYATRKVLPPDQVTLAQHLAHARLILALAEGKTLVIGDRFNELSAWCERDGAPRYPHLDAARKVVAALPADPMNATKPQRELLNFIIADQGIDLATLKQAQDFRAGSPDMLLPSLLVAFAHWRLGHEDEAAAVIAQLRQRARAHPPTLGQLAQIERNNSTTLIMQGHLAKLANATPATHPEEFKRASADANLMARRIRTGHGDKAFDPAKAPPVAREAYAHAATVIALTRLPEGRLTYPAFALQLVRDQNRRELLARLEPAFATASFTHDLPDTDAIAVWRDLLQAAPLDNATSTALAKRATVFEANSISIRIASTAIGLRRSVWLQSRDFVADLRAEFGPNRAVARQLDALDTAIKDCLALDRTPATPELDRRRQAHLNDKNRADAERRRMALAWDQAPEGFKERWDLTNDRRIFQQLGEEMTFHQQQIDAIDGEKAAKAGAPAQAIQTRLAQLFRELNALAGL